MIQSNIIAAMDLLNRIVNRVHHSGSTILNQSEVEEANILLDEIAAEETRAFHSVSNRDAILHFGFTESIEATIISSLLVAERIALQDIAIFPAIAVLANANNYSRDKIAEALQLYVIFSQSRLIKASLEKGLLFYAPHRETANIIANITNDEGLREVADVYNTIQPTWTLIEIREKLGRYSYLVDALLFSIVAGIEALSNDPYLRQLMFEEYKKKHYVKRAQVAIQELIDHSDGHETWYSIVDLAEPLLLKIKEHAQDAIQLRIAQELVLDPIHGLLREKIRKTICSNANSAEECIRKAVDEAYYVAFDKIVQLREQGVLKVNELRNSLKRIRSRDELDRIRETLIELLVTRPRLHDLVLSGVSTICSFYDINEAINAISNILIAAGGGSTNITVSVNPLLILTGIVAVNDFGKIKYLLRIVKNHIGYRVKALLGDEFSKTVIQAYMVASKIVSKI